MIACVNMLCNLAVNVRRTCIPDKIMYEQVRSVWRVQSTLTPLFCSEHSDTPDSDIVGGNLYQRYVDRRQRYRNNNDGGGSDVNDNVKHNELYDHELPESRNIPVCAELSTQTVTEVETILVCTGVYKPGMTVAREDDGEKHYHGHRDFEHNPELYKPTKVCLDACEAVEYILEKENCVLP